jgi:hypothetical protein
MFTAAMNLSEITANQLNRAASIKEKIEVLHKELARILGTTSNSKGKGKNHRTMSASARRKIAAAQRARWAKLRRPKSAQPSTSTMPRKKPMSPAARAKLSAKMKRYWAAKKAGKK